MNRIEAGLYSRLSKVINVEAYINVVDSTNFNGDPMIGLTRMASRMGALSVATLAYHLLPPGTPALDSKTDIGKKIGNINLGSLPPIVNHDYQDRGLLKDLREFVYEYQSLAEIPIFTLLGMFVTKNAAYKLLDLNYRRQSRSQSQIEQLLTRLKNEEISRHAGLAGGLIGGIIGILRNINP